MANKIKYPIIDGRKMCGDCHVMRPINVFRRARRHYTSRCVDCLKVYAAKYRKRPEVKLAMLEYSREYRSIPLNRERLNERTRKWRKSPKAKTQRNLARRAWAAREKQKAIEYKGGKCALCSYSKCAAALDFHHRNPKEKDGYGTGALKQHWRFERNKKELDKCVLLCVRCHREVHAGAVKL